MDLDGSIELVRQHGGSGEERLIDGVGGVRAKANVHQIVISEVIPQRQSLFEILLGVFCPGGLNIHDWKHQLCSHARRAQALGCDVREEIHVTGRCDAAE